MGWSEHHKIGLVYYAPQGCDRGYILFCNSFGGNYAYLIDIDGRVCHQWHSSEGIGYGFLLPNGHLLLRTHAPQESPGSGGATALLELDWDSNVVWEHRSPLMHLDFERLSNGNTLVLQWAVLPRDVASQVQGGYVSEDHPGQMVGDLITEVTPAGEVAWEWRSWEHLKYEEDIICPMENRREWTHQNALNITREEDLIVSFRQISTVGIVDRNSGEFRWKWGPGNISHQHHPTMLDNGHILLFDNGSHHTRPVPYSRVIEVDPATNQIEWEYKADPPFSFFSPLISSAQRLGNGNTLICEGCCGRMFEVTCNREIVWEYINPFLKPGARAVGGGPQDLANTVFRAHRYEPEHPALQGKDLDPGRFGNLNRIYANPA